MRWVEFPNLNSLERVLFNTVVLYIRLVIVMVIGLFSTRIVLDVLGEINFGIYTLVAGVVGMLAILQSAMATTSMRYMSYSLGSGDEKLISRTFNTTLFLHIIIGLAIVVIVEIGGYFMFEYLLDISEDKLFEARIIFHLMALTTFIAIISAPYDAVINSHENLLALSVVDIVGACLQLAVAVYLSYTSLNLLIIYGLGMFLVQLTMRVIKQRYSIKHYKECRLNLKKGIDKSLFKEIMAFSGWNLLGSISAMSVNQIRSILLNIFFGVSVNASEGIARTASSQVNMVSVNLTQAINPQLVKSEGCGDRQRMLRITCLSTKYSVFLFALIAVPVTLEMPYLMNLWLKDVPELAIIFARLSLIALLIEKFTFEITSSIRAVGKIRQFQITETLIRVLNIPVAYLLFKMNFPPKTIYIVGILISLLIAIFRLYFGKKIAELNLAEFFRMGLAPTFAPILIATLLGSLIQQFMDESILRLCLTFSISIVATLLIIRFIGLTQFELNRISSIKQKFLKWKM